jgi:hypothetical protein
MWIKRGSVARGVRSRVRNGVSGKPSLSALAIWHQSRSWNREFSRIQLVLGVPIGRPSIEENLPLERTFECLILQIDGRIPHLASGHSGMLFDGVWGIARQLLCARHAISDVTPCAFGLLNAVLANFEEDFSSTERMCHCFFDGRQGIDCGDWGMKATHGD